jgi:chitodextrinase
MNLQIISLALLAAFSEAAIETDGIWTGHDWYDSASKIGVKNGVPYSDDPLVQHRIKAPQTVDGSIDDTYLSMDNVKRVQAIMSQSDWDSGFP